MREVGGGSLVGEGWRRTSASEGNTTPVCQTGASGRDGGRMGRVSEVSLSAADLECGWGAVEVSGMVLGAGT